MTKAGTYEVLKFGGTSVGGSEAIRQVALVAMRHGPGTVVVVSAMAGVTDLILNAVNKAVAGDKTALGPAVDEFKDKHLKAVRELFGPGAAGENLTRLIHESGDELLELCKSLLTIGEVTTKASAKAVSRGERLLAQILHALLVSKNTAVELIDATKVVKVDHGPTGVTFEPALCEAACREHIVPKLAQGHIVIVPGFIGHDKNGDLVTLGRGGSDYSATILGASIGAKAVYLYKEVDGFLTADPKYAKDARIILELHYREAAELAYYGAKLLHPRAIIPLVDKKIPLIIKNTFHPDLPGTRVAADVLPDRYPVKALTAIPNQALVAVEGKGMMGVPGVAGKTFSALAHEGVSVAMITQGSSEASICFVVAKEQGVAAKKALEKEFRFEIAHKLIDEVRIEEGVAIVAIVGLGMRGTKGIASRTFSAIAKAGANIIAIAQGSSELNISMVIKEKEVPAAVQALHHEYMLHKSHALAQGGERHINICVHGFGQIGRALVKQIQEQNVYFKSKLGVQCDISALTDTSGLLVKQEGFSAGELKTFADGKAQGHKLQQGATGGGIAEQFKKKLWPLPFRKGILCDLTADETAPVIKDALAQGFHVVLANKKPLAVPYAEYCAILETAKAQGRFLRYEATVGAGLPVFDTINKLMDTGDEIMSVYGCLSGTLGYLMTQMEDGVPFSQAVRQAFDLGYTEPDPREDLSGKDVARKALILARTLGHSLNFEDIHLEGLFPKAADHNDPQVFLENLKKLDGEFAEKTTRAKKDKKVLRYVMSLEGGTVKVGLQAVGQDSPMGRLRGTGNQITFVTRRYNANPLIVTGPGAGAEVTAAGVLNDIMAIALTGGT